MSEPNDMRADILVLETKLRPPLRSSLYVPRPRLLQQLAASAGCRLSLVSAPAGYGKTALVADWLASQAGPCAWLSLDEYDDDLQSYLVYLVAAVRTAYPQALNDLALQFKAPALPAPHRLADMLLQGLLELPGPLLLALDDYHAISSPQIHAFMGRVLEHLPPRVHLVLIARADPPVPLGRLRGWGAVGEIRAADLRFTLAETRSLLASLLGSGVSEETAALLDESIEGWAVGLHLAALSLRRQADPAAFARSVAEHGHHAIMEYLLSEVLAGLSAPQRDSLLLSSLFDRFCAPLIDAAQAEDGGRLAGAPFIESLHRANLFVVALDEEGAWFRYHHLFRTLLRVRLAQHYSAAELRAIRIRAWRWFAERGLVEEAVVHALQAGDPAGAAGLVEAQVHPALNREDWRQLDRLLGLLPPEVAARPRLLVAGAWLHFFRWQFGTVAARLDAAEHALNGVPLIEPGADAALRGEISTLRAALASTQGRNEMTVQLAAAALDALPPQMRFAMGLAQFYYVWGLQACGHEARAVEYAQRQLDEQGWQANVQTLRLFLALGNVHVETANLPALQSITTIWYHLVVQSEFGLSIGWSLFGLGWLHYQRNELDAANAYFQRVTAMAWAVHGRAVIDGYTGLVLIALAYNRPDEAMGRIAALREHLLERGMPAFGSVVDALEQRVALARSAPGTPGWRQGAGAVTAAGDFWVQPVLIEVRTLLAAAAATSPATSPAAELVQAAALLAESRTQALARHSQRRLIEIGALEALVAVARGDEAAALASLEEAVMRAAPGGALRLLIDCGRGLIALLQKLQAAGVAPGYIDKLLAAFDGAVAGAGVPQPQPHAARPPREIQASELFTNREIDVIALLAQRLGDKEIAAKLVLSPLTVKKHTQRLYRKLGVNNRRAAVIEARRLGLI